MKWKIKLTLHPTFGKEKYKEIEFETNNINSQDKIYSEAEKYIKKVVSKYPFFIEAYSWEVFPNE